MDIEKIITESVEKAVDKALRKYLGDIAALAANKEEYMDINQVCDALHISKKTYAKLRKQGRIAYIHRGRKIYVKRSDLDAFQDENRIEAR